MKSCTYAKGVLEHIVGARGAGVTGGQVLVTFGGISVKSSADIGDSTHGETHLGLTVPVVLVVVLGLFILPFFLFSRLWMPFKRLRGQSPQRRISARRKRESARRTRPRQTELESRSVISWETLTHSQRSKWLNYSILVAR